MAFIIDTYNEYSRFDREHSKYLFTINERKYAVKEVELEWGVPRIPITVTYNQKLEQYFIYNTLEDAISFARKLKSLN